MEKEITVKKQTHFTEEERLVLQTKIIYQYVNNFKDYYNPIENNLASFDCAIIKRIDFVEINYFFNKRLKDGQKRKIFLYEEAMKMRLIKPNIDKYELLWNVCHVANKDCDLNGLGMYNMLQIVDSALNTNIEEWNKQRIEQQSKYNAQKYKSDFQVNSYYCKLHNLDWREERSKYIKMLKNMDEDNKPKKEKTSDKIARMYLPNLSNRENAKRIGVSEISIRRWLQKNNNNNA